MKAAKVLWCGALLSALFVPCRATAQSADAFAGAFDRSIPWGWNVPGNNPVNTEDPTSYSFSANSLDISAQPGSLYAGNNNAFNIPSLVIYGQPANWYIETAVSTDWTMASPDTYVRGGLIFFADADNYFSFYNNRDAANTPSIQVSSTFEIAGNPRYGGISSVDYDPSLNYVKLRVEGTSDQITFLYDNTGNGFQVAGTVSSTAQPDVFAFLSSLMGKQVGLETDTGGGFNNSPFSFHYFKTNLQVVPYEDDFAGGFNPALPWTFNVALNNPPDTEDSTHYSFSSNSLDILAQPGTLLVNFNDARNIPSLVVLGQPDNWYVETALSTDWSMASTDNFIQAGLIIFADADNYYTFLNNRDGFHPPSVQVSTVFESGGNWRFGGIASGDWDPTQDPVKLRVEGTPTQVSFYFNHTGTWQMAGRVSSTQQPDVYALVSSLVGKQVGFLTDTLGGFNTAPFSFHYLRTNLQVAP